MWTNLCFNSLYMAGTALVWLGLDTRDLMYWTIHSACTQQLVLTGLDYPLHCGLALESTDHISRSRSANASMPRAPQAWTSHLMDKYGLWTCNSQQFKFGSILFLSYIFHLMLSLTIHTHKYRRLGHN